MKHLRKIMQTLFPGALLLVMNALMVTSAPPDMPTGQSCVAPPNGLVSWWPGDGYAADLTGGNHGTLQNGAGFGTGQVGQAFNFDGANDQVHIDDAANLHLSSGEFTVMAWVYFNSANPAPTGGDMSIVDKMNNPVVNLDGWRLGRQKENLDFWFCFGGGGVNGCQPGIATTVQSTTMALQDVWYHVAGVLSSSAISIYVNGTLESSKPRPGFTDTNSTDLLIGANVLEGAFFDGLVDEVALFNRALSTPEIVSIFNAGSAGFCRTNVYLPAVVNGP